MPGRQWRVRWLAVAVGVVGALMSVRAAEDAAIKKALEAEARMRRDITFLASPECEGRGPTTKGINLAADYIADQFKQAGLKPAGKDGSYFQPFAVYGATLDGTPKLVLHGPDDRTIELTRGKQFDALGLSGSGQVSAPLVFVGYGITSPKGPEYDEYQGLDVEGKVVVILRDTPRAGDGQTLEGPWKRRYASLNEKLRNAKAHKAAAVIFVNDHKLADGGDDLMDFNWQAMVGSGAAEFPVFHVRRSVLADLLRSAADKDLTALEAAVDRDLKPQSLELTGWTAQGDVKVTRSAKQLPLKNIVGYLEGHGPLANETVVVGAHYDHVGYGGFASLAQVRKPTIHPGADDNGSGSTSIMELARRFAATPNREGRRIVFIAFSGEELGLYGSRHYCKEPLFPLGDTVAMVNLDMVGRLRDDKLQIWGLGTAKTFEAQVDRLNKKHHFQLDKSHKGGNGPSDHDSFYNVKVPVFFFFTGDHPDYHRPNDLADRINVTGMRKVMELAEDLVAELASDPKRPEYVKVGGGGGGFSPGGGPKLGIRPIYEDDGKGGLAVDGVDKEGPAGKAGMKAGDRIVEIAGKPVKNIEAYMSLMRTQKPGQLIDVVVMRDGKRVVLNVKPE